MLGKDVKSIKSLYLKQKVILKALTLKKVHLFAYLSKDIKKHQKKFS